MKKITKTDAEWRAQLSEDAYRVTRTSGTERPFTGEYYRGGGVGTYACVCCGQPIFQSDAKFDAGCGWPSFWKPLQGARLEEIVDTTHGMTRVEVRCAGCDAHLGHVFPDGPAPTGLRDCINSVALVFEPTSESSVSSD